MSNGQRRADVYPTWIRVDFPVEREITKVVLKKRPLAEKRESWSKLPVKGAQEFGRGMPSKLSVEASADGLNWTKIFDGTLPDSDKKDVFEFTTAPLKAKMVRVVATEIPLVECEGHCFAIAEFEVCDKSGRNVAEISNGTGILASSSYNYNRFSYEFHGALWKIHNELGAKLIRMGYHDDPINWHCVERERGVLKVDKTADEAPNIWRGKVKFSEIRRAKFIAQRYVTDTGNGVPSYFCKAYNPFYGAFELSLLRRAADEGACTLQPSAAFYAVRNIATITDGFEPLDFDIKAASQTDISKLRKYAFKTPKGYAAALWIGVNAADKSERRPVDIFVPFKFSSASATDVLNGARQNLKMSADGKLKNVMLNDTPLIVEFER